MKSNEFRIGNLVHCEFLKKYHKLTINEIIGYKNDWVFLLVENEEQVFKLKEIEPITLTEEWLLKFGWGKGEYDTEYCDNVSFKQYALSYITNSNLFCIEANSDIIEIPNIIYVHQLQNLYFALTGEELTIQ